MILEKLFNINCLQDFKASFYYGIGLLLSIYGHIRAENIWFDKVEIKVPQWKEEKTKQGGINSKVIRKNHCSVKFL